LRLGYPDTLESPGRKRPGGRGRRPRPPFNPARTGFHLYGWSRTPNTLTP
jgi:hypothetical protein